jgi:hypothetical protein
MGALRIAKTVNNFFKNCFVKQIKVWENRNCALVGTKTRHSMKDMPNIGNKLPPAAKIHHSKVTFAGEPLRDRARSVFFKPFCRHPFSRHLRHQYMV